MTGGPNARPTLLIGVFTATLLLVALAGGIGVGEATAEQTVGECREINDSFVGQNSTVVLQNDVQAPGDCFTVTADGVTFDGNGHAIVGSGDEAGVVVAVDGVTVTNATVDEFQDGVRVEGTDATVDELTAVNSSTGVRFGTDQTPAAGSVDGTFSNNTRGVHVANVGAGGVRVAGAEVANNTEDGVLVDADSGQVEVVNARVADNDGAGVNVMGHAEGRVLVRTSNLLRNQVGVVVADARNVTVRQNDIDRSGSAAVALRGDQTDANHTVAGNVIDTPGESGVSVTTGGVVVRNNSVTDAGTSALRVAGAAPDVRLVDNTVRDGQTGLVVEPFDGEAPSNTTVVSDDYLGSQTAVVVRGAVATTLADVTVESRESTVRGVVVLGATDPTIERLTVRYVGGPGLLIGEPSDSEPIVSPTLAEPEIAADDPTVTGATVVGGTYEQNDVGIQVATATDTRLSGVTVTGNGARYRGDGIAIGPRVFQLSEQTVRNTTITGARVDGNAVGLVGTGANDTVVRDSTFSENRIGVTFGGVENVRIEDVSVTDSRDRGGVYLYETRHAVVADVTAGGNQEGVELIRGDDITVRNSTLVANAGSGVVARGTRGLRVTGTEVSENAVAGVTYLGSGAEGAVTGQNTTVDVTALQNGGPGIVFQNSPGATVRDSLVRGNGVGIEAGDDVRVVDTTVANNTGVTELPVEPTVTELSPTAEGRETPDSLDVTAGENVTVANLTVGNATLTGTLDEVNATGVAPPAGPPGDRVRLGGNVDISPQPETASFADVRIGYTDAEAVPADEDNASLYHYNGTAWVAVANSTSDPAANAVGGNVTAFSNVSAFAEPDDPPVAGLSATQTNGDVSFDASASSDPDSAIDSYEWDFDGDGSVDETTSGATTTHGYASGGTYEAVVRVVSGPLNDTANVTVSVVTSGDSGGDVGDLSSRISIESLDADRDEIRAGDTVRVTARLRNDGTFGDNVEVRLTADGERVESRTVTVPGDETRTVTFERRFDEPGEYGLSVNGRSLGTVRVLGAAGERGDGPTPTATPVDTGTSGPADTGTTAAASGPSDSSGETTPTEDSGPGFGAVGALVALVSLAALALRRRS